MDEEGRVKFIGFVEEAGELSKVRIFPQFCEGIRGLNEYSHIIQRHPKWMCSHQEPEPPQPHRALRHGTRENRELHPNLEGPRSSTLSPIFHWRTWFQTPGCQKGHGKVHPLKSPILVGLIMERFLS